MRTQEDIDNHPLADLFGANFDNHDAAFALDIPSFTDWRKSLDRADNLNLPRYDKNPARPVHRLAHLYEYALVKELTKSLTKEVACLVIRDQFSEMAKGVRLMSGRQEQLSKDLQDMVAANSTISDLSNLPNKDGIDFRKWDKFGCMVDWPWLGFSSDLLDRTEDRLKDPLIWLIATNIEPSASRSLHKVVKTTGNSSIVNALSILTVPMRNLSDDPEQFTDYRSLIAINVTGTLTDIERKLRIRLRGRRLKGDTE